MEICLSGLRSATRPAVLRLPGQLCAQARIRKAYSFASKQNVFHLADRQLRHLRAPHVNRTVKAMSAASTSSCSHSRSVDHTLCWHF